MDFTKKKLDEMFGAHGKITSSTLAMYTAEEYKEKLEKDELRAKIAAEKKKAADEAAKAKADADAKDGKAADAKADAKAESASAKTDKPAADTKSAEPKSDSKDVKSGEKCKGFGFVNYETPEQAQAAVNALNGQFSVQPLYLLVCWFGWS